MAQLPSVFKPADAEDATFAPLPANWYKAKIVKSELKETKAKTGKYISLTFKVMQGKFKNRLVFTNLNIINPNDTAVRIAYSDLKKITEACAIEELGDTTELHGIPLGIKLSVKEATASFPAGNDIKDYSDESDVPDSDDDEEDGDNPFSGFGTEGGDDAPSE